VYKIKNKVFYHEVNSKQFCYCYIVRFIKFTFLERTLILQNVWLFLLSVSKKKSFKCDVTTFTSYSFKYTRVLCVTMNQDTIISLTRSEKLKIVFAPNLSVGSSRPSAVLTNAVYFSFSTNDLNPWVVLRYNNSEITCSDFV